TWPTIKIGILFSLAIFINSDVHSRTCVTLPAALVTSSRYMVWIESIITTEGLTSFICSEISNRFVSANTYNELEVIPRRSARSFVCLVDSSPDIYKTDWSFSANCDEICNSNVDFPIPGSPPIKISDPGTIPPPSTRLNSSMFVVMRGSFSDAIELIFCGLLGFRMFPPTDCTDRAGATSSSTKVFHSLQPGHFPIHFSDSYPHS